MQKVCDATHFEYKHLLTRCYKLKQLKRNLLLLSIFCLKTKGVLLVKNVLRAPFFFKYP